MIRALIAQAMTSAAPVNVALHTVFTSDLFGNIGLRAFRDADSVALFEYITDSEVNKQLVVMLPRDPAMLAQTVAGMTLCLGNDYCFVVVEQKTDAAIGFARLILEGPDSGSISYFLGRQFWGHGYGSQIVGLLGQLGFGRLNRNSLRAQVFAGNLRSVRVLERMGFTLVAEHNLGGADPLRSVEREEQRREVRAVLARLPERQAAALVLRYSGLSYAEVATALGMPADQIGTVLRRAEAAMRKEMIHATPI